MKSCSAWLFLLACASACAPLGTVRTPASRPALADGYCADITPAERCGLLLRLPRALEVTPLSRTVLSNKLPQRVQLIGASLVFPAPADINPAWLQRTLICHQADVAAHPSLAAADDPLVLPGAWLDVAAHQEGGTLVVTLASSDPAQAEAILARARAWHSKPLACAPNP